MLDREALRQYRMRLAELDDELDDAQARHDAARHAKRSTERDALLEELARATGLGGKPDPSFEDRHALACEGGVTGTPRA